MDAAPHAAFEQDVQAATPFSFATFLLGAQKKSRLNLQKEV